MRLLPQQKKNYSVSIFTRLFGNKNNNNSWGTIEENGVGKFNDFTDKALDEIKALGATYGRVPHMQVGIMTIGISNDDDDVM
jgi:hypothetical protein